jgi:hypothetical protein
MVRDGAGAPPHHEQAVSNNINHLQRLTALKVLSCFPGPFYAVTKHGAASRVNVVLMHSHQQPRHRMQTTAGAELESHLPDSPDRTTTQATSPRPDASNDYLVICLRLNIGEWGRSLPRLVSKTLVTESRRSLLLTSYI